LAKIPPGMTPLCCRSGVEDDLRGVGGERGVRPDPGLGDGGADPRGQAHVRVPSRPPQRGQDPGERRHRGDRGAADLLVPGAGVHQGGVLHQQRVHRSGVAREPPEPPAVRQGGPEHPGVGAEGDPLQDQLGGAERAGQRGPPERTAKCPRGRGRASLRTAGVQRELQLLGRHGVLVTLRGPPCTYPIIKLDYFCIYSFCCTYR
jgi:hypothetical protein